MSSLNNNPLKKLPFTGEAVVASLMEAGHLENHIKVNYKGGFKKGFSNDIENLNTEPSDTTARFDLALNRDGIYDCLPEGLFHQTKGSGRVSSVTESVEEHKQFKEEERQARNFFAPLEQVLFQYKTAAEQAERDALYNIQNRSLTPSFYAFWNISTNLPTAGANKLLQLMPYSAAIKGHADTTAIALAYVLSKKVHINTTTLLDEACLNGKPWQEQRLGVDSIIGDKSGELLMIWHFSILDLQQEELPLYVPGAPMRNLFDRFLEIFVPLDVDVVPDFIPSEDIMKKQYENILGVGAYL